MDSTMKTEIKINFTRKAQEQLKLIREHDYTLEGQYFRLKIDGKGCNGFEYALGFTPKFSEDIEFPIIGTEDIMLIDSFTAHYCDQGEIDFLCDPENEQEGFYYTNPREKEYRGKFFKNEEKLPPKTT